MKQHILEPPIQGLDAALDIIQEDTQKGKWNIAAGGTGASIRGGSLVESWFVPIPSVADYVILEDT